DENFEEVKNGLALKVPAQKLNTKNTSTNPNKKRYDDDVEPDDFEGI
ncbi:hypothetical protein RDH42_005014, partial [Escherichia coli]|nr:hypothetical protein [Escherichia coli]